MSESVISLPDRFDFSTHRWFTAEYEKALSKKQPVVLDFSRVQYVDSSALGMMVLLHRSLVEKKQTGSIRNLSGTAKDILDMANFNVLYRYD